MHDSSPPHRTDTALPRNPAFNLAAHVLAHAAHAPDHDALLILHPDGAPVGAPVGTVERWTYGALERAVRGCAAGLLAQGLARGDRILMRLDNSVEFPITFLAALAVDLVPVPTSAALSAPEVADMIDTLAPALIVRGEGVALPDNPPCPVLPAGALTAFRDLPAAPYVMGPPDRPGYIIYTSGTSGQPRAVCHAHRAILARAMMLQGWEGLGAGDRILHAGAFNWTYTLGTGLMDPWTCGATALIPAKSCTSADLFTLLAQHEATIFAAAPGVYRQMLRTGPGPALPTLRHGLSAGEKLPAVTAARWRARTGTPIHEAYGMSECSTFISGSPGRPAPEGALGYAQEGRRIALLNTDGAPVPVGQPGTIAVSSDDPGLMLGYLNAPDETAARYRNGWFLTGDQAVQAPDGAFTYLGRNDDMMNAGGYRVSPLEIEAVLNAHPDILESGAVEVRVKADTTVIAACYTTRNTGNAGSTGNVGSNAANAPLDARALSRYAAQRLARYKQPRIYRHLPALPKGANGKLLRARLRQIIEADHDTA